jgi:16S rRNA (uracil1498-N3)-methyltransferase
MTALRHRLFHAGPLPAHAEVRLDADASHHAVRVLRLRPGATVELFDGAGTRAPATLVDAEPGGATVRVGALCVAGTEAPVRLSLAQAIPSGDRMDWIVEKAVELGVAEVQPLVSQRTLLRLDAARMQRRVEHWRRIVVAACMQCGRDRLPAVHEPLPLTRWLGAADAVERRLLTPRGEPMAALGPAPSTGLWLLAGPEGGFTDDEERAARAAGCRPWRLGPRTLRAETAALAALAALQACGGDF